MDLKPGTLTKNVLVALRKMKTRTLSIKLRDKIPNERIRQGTEKMI